MSESTPTELSVRDVSGAHAPAGGCDCGHEDEHLPELDARTIPHAIRHGAIFGSLGQLRAGASLVLTAPHDPVPLLAQLRDREGDAIAVEYLQRGPQDWRLKMTRTR
ncbi:MAG: DUF2249 domain-containing protein [Dermatophilaceae bacterium]|nr:DUF2249 domain-containing protein [Intrasporangiaceae bacterium]